METGLNLVFRKAAMEDLDAVFQVFCQAIAEMDRNGIPQWDERYPDKAILAEDISKAELSIGLLGADIASVFVLNAVCDPEYENGAWQYPDATYRIIHRLCVNPKFQNQGIGSRTMRHIEAQLKADGIDCVRLDAFTRNPYALRMYDKLGYLRVGTADWRKGRFWLMEKKL